MMAKAKEVKRGVVEHPDAKSTSVKDRSAHENARHTKKQRLSHLSKGELTDEEFSDALDTIRRESDRGAAIMGAALVEEALFDLLDTQIRNPDRNAALFHDPGAPLNTMRAKAVAAYALGLCDKKTFNQIEIIREVRNQFSHALRAISFDRTEIAHATEGLTRDEPPGVVGNNRNLASPRDKYEAACLGIWFDLAKITHLELSVRIEQLKRRDVALKLAFGALKGSA